jgi:hypothetical protein
MQSPKEKFGLVSNALASTPEVEAFCQRHDITFVRFYKTNLEYKPIEPSCYAREEYVPFTLSSFSDLTNATQTLFGHREFDAFVSPSTDYQGRFRFRVDLTNIARKLRKNAATDPRIREDIDKYLTALSAYDTELATYNDTLARAKIMSAAIFAKMMEIEATQEFIDYCVEYVTYHAKAAFSQSNICYLKHVDATNVVLILTEGRLSRTLDEEEEDESDYRSC